MSPHGDDHYDSYGGDHGPAGTDGRLTRTRLPDGDGDAFGTGRRPRPTTKPSRSLLTVVTVVVLLIAAIAFANRGGGDSDDGDGGGSGDAKGNQAQSTAPTGERPVKGKDTTTGIATGFPRTEQGAQSAAANYAVALGSVEMYSRDSRHAIVNTVYAPEAAAARQAPLDKVYSSEKLRTAIGLDADGKAPKGMTFVCRSNPIGTKIVDFKGNTASVAVWYSTLVGMAGEDSKWPVTEGWYTKTFELKWIDDDWKVTDYQQQDGPAPVGRDQTASSAEEMADAVQRFGGFTYAR
ncbi:hypothetical protein H8N01_22210 [Streptomyces sp. AC536]|uniref:hypothetical protein n=1 Tax=Streptomyces buecherae TaxID=2763006 RepID=UPI00164EBE85|nr:hypothetical protein [Streptomyces buecherae]MBC3985213.1 hypothetical protein [Streptomyces buecherae]QNJ41642.1 hypothetical protein H7H31_19020 [Streptomyces buecherae]